MAPQGPIPVRYASVAPQHLRQADRRPGRLRCRDLGPDWHARYTDRSRKARNARRQLEALAYDVIITLRQDAA